VACEKLFTAIKDGEWHNLNDLAKTLEISIQKLTQCAEYLAKQGIVTQQPDTRNIKIEPDWKNRLPEEALTEEPIEN
jgi:uncharacterized lipoprotein YmbA